MRVFKISVKTESRLTKNGMKRTPSRTLQGLTKKHRAMALKLAIHRKKEIGLKKPIENPHLIIRSYWSNIPMDYDGLACAIAPTIDGIVDAGVMVDDSPRIVRGYHMEFEKVAKRNEVRVEVSVISEQQYNTIG